LKLDLLFFFLPCTNAHYSHHSKLIFQLSCWCCSINRIYNDYWKLWGLFIQNISAVLLVNMAVRSQAVMWLCAWYISNQQSSLQRDLSAVALMVCLPNCAWRLFIMACTFLPRKSVHGFHLNSPHMWITEVSILLMASLILLQTTKWWPLFLRSFHTVCTSFVCVYCDLWRYVSPKSFIL
jgi:hypothetical protein